MSDLRERAWRFAESLAAYEKGYAQAKADALAGLFDRCEECVHERIAHYDDGCGGWTGDDECPCKRPRTPDHGTRWPEDSTKGHAWSGSHYPGRSKPPGAQGPW